MSSTFVLNETMKMLSWVNELTLIFIFAKYNKIEWTIPLCFLELAFPKFFCLG